MEFIEFLGIIEVILEILSGKKKKNLVGYVWWKSNEVDWFFFNYIRFSKLMI